MRVGERLTTLPPYPIAGRDVLPPPRRDWSAALWAGGVVLAAVTLARLAVVFAPAAWLAGLVPGFAAVLVAGLAACATVGLGLTVFAWDRTGRGRDD